MSENSGSRPFSPIYENFQDLLNNNQGIFRLFKKTKNPGMYQAVWLARQAEVETLQRRLEQTEALLENQKHCALSSLKQQEQESENLLRQQEQASEESLRQRENHFKEQSDNWEEAQRAWFEQHAELLYSTEQHKQTITIRETSISKQKETIQGLEKEIEVWKEKSIDLREDKEKYKVLTRSLERVVNMKTKQDDKSQRDMGKIKTHLNLSQHALIKLDDEYSQIEIENKKLRSELEELREKLDKNEDYTKEYRKINHRMENELYRVTNELEKVQSLLN